MEFKAWLPALLLAGCLDINRPASLLYTTDQEYAVPNNSGLAWGIRMSLSFYDKDSTLELRYEEPRYLGSYPDSTVSVVLYIDTAPPLEPASDGVAEADLRVELSPPKYIPGDTTKADATMRVLARRGREWDTISVFSSAWYFDRFLRYGSLWLPESLLGNSPALAWRVGRSIDGQRLLFPDVPALLIRDEARFKRQLY